MGLWCKISFFEGLLLIVYLSLVFLNFGARLFIVCAAHEFSVCWSCDWRLCKLMKFWDGTFWSFGNRAGVYPKCRPFGSAHFICILSSLPVRLRSWCRANEICPLSLSDPYTYYLFCYATMGYISSWWHSIDGFVYLQQCPMTICSCLAEAQIIIHYLMFLCFLVCSPC